MKSKGTCFKLILGMAIVAFSCSDMGKNPDNGPVNHPPMITSSATATAFEGVRFVYRATAQDPDGTTPTITFADYPAWLAASGDTIYGTAAAGTPDASFTVSAFDGFLADTLIVSVMVIDTSEAPNRPPVVTSPDTATAQENQMFTYTASAQDPDGNSPTISFAAYPAWLVPSGVTISGTPAVGTPDTSFQVIASDGLLADTLIVSITVADGQALISYAAEIQPIFSANCALSGCHTGMNPPANLRLQSYNSLMNGSQSGPVIVAFEPDNSILIMQIEGTRLPRMPFGQPPLPDSTIQLIRAWVAQGALNN